MTERQPDLRRHPRAQVSWLVTVETADQRFDLQTLNLSPFGAKLRANDNAVDPAYAPAPLKPGTPAQLHFRPPGGRPVAVQAIVWRTDPDGPAFFFVGIDEQDFTFPIDGMELAQHE
jgi:PilZ domain-containing protein